MVWKWSWMRGALIAFLLLLARRLASERAAWRHSIGVCWGFYYGDICIINPEFYGRVRIAGDMLSSMRFVAMNGSTLAS